MKTMFKILVVLVATISPAFAWKETGGGDEVALDFQRAFSNAVGAVKAGKIAGAFTAEDLQQTAKDSRVLVVEDRLVVTFNGIAQDSIAANTPSKGIIQINRSRWKNLRDDRLKEAVALHEVLSLRRIESTGDYSYSARYLEAYGLSPWLVSGAKEETSQSPRPKFMNCEIEYFPNPNEWNSRQIVNYEQMTAETGDTQPRSLSVRKTLSTKDGRYDIYLWAVQPFRSAYNPFPLEFTSITIVDKKRKASSRSGPLMVGDAAELDDHMRQTKASLATFNDDALTDIEAMVNVKCGLK